MIPTTEITETYIAHIQSHTRKHKDFQKIPPHKMEKFFEAFRILMANYEYLNIHVFESKTKIRFSASIEKEIKHCFDKNTHITVKQMRAQERLKNNEIYVQKMDTINSYVNCPEYKKTSEYFSRLEECIQRRVIPFISGLPERIRIARP